ncbi:MAG: ABC transporter permease [Chloroflexi bacterium]|nr:ABC transporter permease [Chloroflexota bacterium]
MEAARNRVGLSGLRRRRRSRVPFYPLVRFLRTKPLGVAGGGLILLLILTAIFAPWLAPYDPYELRVDHLFVPPAFAAGGQEFLLGTDNYGRDLLSRLIWGARISVYVGFVSVGVGSIIGALWGLSAAYLGGKFDLITLRFVDGMQAVPGLILALTIMAALGQSLTNVIIAIGFQLIDNQCRVIRSAGLAVRQTMYVEAARAIGAPDPRILLRHMLPNCLAPYIILVSAELGGAILAEASLSFLGLGTPPPNPSWGAMLSGGAQQFVQRAPWMAIFPGLTISAAVFGFNLLGDALRDVLDPRLRRS